MPEGQNAGEQPAHEGRVNTYRRLMNAELALRPIRRRRPLGLPELSAVLEATESPGPEIEPEDDLYLAVLVRYVASLGGHVEVSAVFPEDTITLLRDPDPAPPAH